MNKFKDIWDKNHDIQKARRMKLQELMSDYDENIYRPALLKLKEDCGELGHHEGSYDRNYHDNGLGWAKFKCSYCSTDLKIWLDGIELKVEDGRPVNDGKNWIRIDGSLGPSCVDEDETYCDTCDNTKKILIHEKGCNDDRSEGVCSLCHAIDKPCPDCTTNGNI